MKDSTELKTIWTIGHSTHPPEVFLEMLSSFKIQVLADVRRYPGSRRYPHFNSDALAKTLADSGIDYMHFPELGGRRQPARDSINLGWKHAAFRGYADYLSTPDFMNAASKLETLAMERRTAFMCSEAPWWRCHRAIISDYLKVRNWEVLHIMKAGKAQLHPYTSAAKVVDGKLDYTGNTLPFN